MFSRGATQVHAQTPGMMDDVMGDTRNSVHGAPPVDLLDLDMNFDFMSAERQQQLMAELPTTSDRAPQNPQVNNGLTYTYSIPSMLMQDTMRDRS